MISRWPILALFASSTAAAGPKKTPPPPAAAPAPAPAPVSAVDNQWPRPAGSKQRIVGVLDVKVEGVPPDIAAQFQQSLEAQIDTKRFWIAPRSRMHELMANSTRWTEGCVVGGCLQEVRAQTGAQLVLLVALTGSGTSFGHVVTLVRTDTGRVLAQEQERCDVCTVSEALTAATLGTVKILNAVPERLPDEQVVDAYPQIRAATMPLEERITQLESAPHRQHVVGVTLTLLGVAAGAAGLITYVLQNHANYGLATAAAGAGLAVGGVVTLTF